MLWREETTNAGMADVSLGAGCLPRRMKWYCRGSGICRCAGHGTSGVRAKATWAAIVIGTAFPLVLHGQIDPAALLLQARTKIVEDNHKLTKHTCVQTVRRSRFEALLNGRSTPCGHADEAEGPLSPMLASTDQFKLEVTISDGAEIFSWVGAQEFQSSDAQDVVGGGLTSTGDFGRFLMSIFGPGAAEHQYLGLEQSQGHAVAVYRYRVPKSSSRYQMKVGSKPEDLATMAYEGKFWITPQSAELRRLTIVVPEPPLESQTCRVETTIDYQRVQIRGSWLLLPELTLLKLWDADGSRLENGPRMAPAGRLRANRSFGRNRSRPLAIREE